MDERERLLAEAPRRLQEVVRIALNEPEAVLGTWSQSAVKGGFGTLDAPRSLVHLQGMAQVGAVERPWRVVFKALTRADGHDDPADSGYWRREPLVYQSGLLGHLPASISAPHCYACDEPADGVIWLWLEHIEHDAREPWSLDRWHEIARMLGRFNNAYMAGQPLPHAPWLGAGRLRTWLERHRPLVQRIAAAPDNPAVSHWWPRPVVDGLLRLWQERAAFCAALQRLPHAFGHGDAIRRNLLLRRTAKGAAALTLIDWEHAGRYAVGEEIGQTLSTAAPFFDIDPAGLPELEVALLEGYLTGLQDAGGQPDARLVRAAMLIHAALRNAFNAVGATPPNEVQRAAAVQTYGHTFDSLAARRAELRPVILAWADTARRLLETL